MGDYVRFDDRLATMLAWEGRTASDRARIWRQIADLLGTAGHADPLLVQDALARLDELDADVPRAERRHYAAALDPERATPALLDYLDRDFVRPAAPAVSAEQAVDGLEQEDVLELEAVEAPQFVDAPGAEPAAPAAGGNQIADLLARLDAYHATRSAPAELGFDFQIDEEGGLHALDGGPLLANCAEPPLGVDGQAAGAWREGAGFADARLVVDRGPHAGEWRISAEPDCDLSGRVTGYRGFARAPRADETAVIPPSPGTREEAARLDAALGRLREPLEAVVEAADPETLPPGEIRAAAAVVASQGAALAAAVDALEIAIAAAGDGGLDIAALLVRIDGALQPLAVARGLDISFRLAKGLPPVVADPQAVERMIARLIGAVVALGRPRERIVARLGRDKANGRMLALSVTRPGRLTGWPPQALLDPPPALGEGDAPELGLGFALRLVDRLAQEAGGGLVIHEDRIVLTLPLRAEPRVIRMRWS